jgi:hypothetical protein
MSVESFAPAVSSTRPARRSGLGLVGAELLKLRRRRGLVLASVGFTVVPMLVGYGVVAAKHASDPVKHGPGGGTENFVQAIDLLTALAALAAILIGVTAGTGDLRAGVFRELVITGRSRLSLFGARVPGGLALLIPIVAAALGVAVAAAFAFADGAPTPDLQLVLEASGWILLTATATFALALGVSSVVGSTGPSIGLLLGWQAIVGPLVIGMDSLGGVRTLFPGAGLVAMAPGDLELQEVLTMSSAAIVGNIVLWIALPLAAGAWRTNTRDA